MATTKTATLTIRVDPNLKEALRSAAQTEHCEKNGIAIEQSQDSDQRGERS